MENIKEVGAERENEKEQHGSNRSSRERGTIHREAGQEFSNLGKYMPLMTCKSKSQAE